MVPESLKDFSHMFKVIFGRFRKDHYVIQINLTKSVNVSIKNFVHHCCEGSWRIAQTHWKDEIFILPAFRLKCSFSIWSGFTRIWWKPVLKSIFVKNLDPPMISNISSEREVGVRFLFVILFNSLQSTTARSGFPCCFAKNRGAPYGLLLILIRPLSFVLVCILL